MSKQKPEAERNIELAKEWQGHLAYLVKELMGHWGKVVRLSFKEYLYEDVLRRRPMRTVEKIGMLANEKLQEVVKQLLRYLDIWFTDAWAYVTTDGVYVQVERERDDMPALVMKREYLYYTLDELIDMMKPRLKQQLELVEVAIHALEEAAESLRKDALEWMGMSGAEDKSG
jgi:predicted nucleic acid-binding protein